ncbi:MAG: GFA family protein [Rhodospirillaceae bacterium]|nr:GFA family protein [Rhodospirillaceae bacterium]
MIHHVKGGCLCGAVRYEVTGPLRPVIACHCSQCRRVSGHFTAATAAAHENISITGGETLTWFVSSDTARRGFCRLCGSNLFWQGKGRPYLSIMAGSLDSPTGLKLDRHIFVADKGDYYEIADGVAQSLAFEGYDPVPPGS